MAGKLKVKTSGNIMVVIGPTEPIPGPMGPNPADALRTGQLGTRHYPDQTLRRPFNIPTKSALHRNEGLSNDEFNQPTHPEDVGVNHNKYSQGENPEFTSEGQPIRGT